MQKNKIATSGLISLLFGLGLVLPAYANGITPQVAIAQLPEYIRIDYFRLSCTSLGGSTAQFSYKKEGGSYSNFGPAINLGTTSCLVNVTSSQIDSQTKYYFKVNVDGTEKETSTTYDVSGPDPVRDYSKDKMGPTTYRIHWTTPGNSDFYQVFIYRGESADFSANDDKKVAGIAGAKDTNMSWDDAGLDPNKTYYYIIRALDKAGNSSSLVGDAGTVLGTTTVTTAASTGTGQGTEGTVRALPQEEAQGEVLQEATEAPTETPQTLREAAGEAVDTIKASRTLTGIALAAFLIGLAWYFLSRRRS